jgi:hypothetical protein
MTVRELFRLITAGRSGSVTAGSSLRLIAAGLLGVCAAVLVACGSSGKGLIPVANAGPLQSDFRAIAEAAEAGNGNCTPTKTALSKTEHDLGTLPSTIDGGLRGRLEEGFQNLRSRALALCGEPLSPATATTATTAPPPSTARTPPTATTEAQATTPTSTGPASTTTQPSGNGGAQAPGSGDGESQDEEGPAGGAQGGAGGSESNQNGGTGPGAGQ